MRNPKYKIGDVLRYLGEKPSIEYKILEIREDKFYHCEMNPPIGKFKFILIPYISEHRYVLTDNLTKKKKLEAVRNV